MECPFCYNNKEFIKDTKRHELICKKCYTVLLQPYSYNGYTKNITMLSGSKCR